MPPSPASVRLMEEMVIEYIVALVTKVCFLSCMFGLVVVLCPAVASFVSRPDALNVSPVTSRGGRPFSSYRCWRGVQSIMREKALTRRFLSWCRLALPPAAASTSSVSLRYCVCGLLPHTIL